MLAVSPMSLRKDRVIVRAMERSCLGILRWDWVHASHALDIKGSKNGVIKQGRVV